MIRKTPRINLAAVIVTVTALLLAASPALAQSFQGTGVFQNVSSEARNIGKIIIDAIFAITGIAGAICLVPAGIKYFKGESQSKDSITSVGIGLITIFIILSMIKTVHGYL